MLPFAAQGAGMAIEDAAVLAKCLGESAGETARRHAGRAEALRAAAPLARGAGAARGAAQGRIYHLTGPDGARARSRDQGDGPQRMLARQDWIYDWRL